MSEQPPKGIFLYSGANRQAKLDQIQSIADTYQIDDLDKHRMDIGAMDATSFMSLCRSEPAASVMRLIVVDQADKLTKTWGEILIANVDSIAKNACVILLAEKALKAGNPLKALKTKLKKETFESTDDTAQKPFALIEALSKQDTAKGLYILHKQLQEGKEPFEMIGLIAWQLQRWMHTRRLLDEGYSGDRLAKALGMSAWQVKKAQEEVRWRSQDQLRGLLEKTWDCDTAMKTGRAQPLPAIEQLLFELCQRN